MNLKVFSAAISYFSSPYCRFIGRLAAFFALIWSLPVIASADCNSVLTVLSEEAIIEQPWLFPEALKNRLSLNPQLSLVDVPAPEMIPQIQFMIETLKKSKSASNKDYQFFKRQTLIARH